MLTALDALPSTLDRHEKDFVAMVRKYQWRNTEVFADAGLPGFSYSTGFFLACGAPEVIVFSLPTAAHDILWDIYRDLEKGIRFEIGKRNSDVLAHGDVAFMPVSKARYGEYLGWSRWFYGDDRFDCLQLIWADREGLFPWQVGVDAEVARSQPDLSEGGWASWIRQ